MTLAGLESFHGVASNTVDDGETGDTYAQNGMDASRIKKAVRSPTCSCKCRVPIQLLIKICSSFWPLTKGAQDAILWSLQTTGEARRKRYYQIEGRVLELCNLVEVGHSI